MNFDSLLWVLLLGSLLGLELIGKVPPTLHTPLMSGANAISGITMLAGCTVPAAVISIGKYRSSSLAAQRTALYPAILA